MFQTGHQLINVPASFNGDKKITTITLQELLNNLYKLGIWSRYGFLDISCETGNQPLSHAIRNYKETFVRTWRGGNQLKKRREYTKKKKYTKKKYTKK